MNSAVLLAALHHLAAFTVVAMLAVELATFRPPFSAQQARRLQRVDLVFGVSAMLLLIVGLMLELTAIVVILPCAALMARGFGYLR